MITNKIVGVPNYNYSLMGLKPTLIIKAPTLYYPYRSLIAPYKGTYSNY